MSFYVQRDADETWREAVAKQGRKHGMEREVLETFDAELVRNPDVDQADAAFHACYEWDACDLVTPPRS
jgi:hypothetical protein